MAYDQTDRLLSAADRLDAQLRHAQPTEILRAAHQEFGDKLALVSSFVVLAALVHETLVGVRSRSFPAISGWRIL